MTGQIQLTTLQMDPCGDGEDMTPSLVERNQSQLESVHGQPHHKESCLWLWDPALGLMAGGSIQAAPCQT